MRVKWIPSRATHLLKPGGRDNELDADLIVVSAGNRGRVLGRLLGNLAMDLVQRAGRQVLVVSEPG